MQFINNIKSLVIIILLIFSFSSYAGWFSSEEKCYKSDNTQARKNKAGEMVLYFLNQDKLFSGSICKEYKDGKIKSKINYEDGKLDGSASSWYENGQKKIENHFQNGKREGDAYAWYENGQIEIDANYKDGVRDGERSTWYENGQKELESNYEDGLKDGEWIEWYADGQKKSEGEYDNDLQEGEWRDWYTNGQIYSIENYKKGWCDGPSEYWREDGSKEYEVRGYEYKDGAEMCIIEDGGVITNWYENSQKMSEGEYSSDGKLNGDWEDWHKNGQKNSKGEYKNDLKDGLWKEWHSNGNIKSKIEYKKGIKNGDYETWFVNGQKEFEGEYRNNQKNGEWRKWDANGDKLYAYDYENGKQKSKSDSGWFSSAFNKLSFKTECEETEEFLYKVVEAKDNGVKASEVIADILIYYKSIDPDNVNHTENVFRKTLLTTLASFPYAYKFTFSNNKDKSATIWAVDRIIKECKNGKFDKTLNNFKGLNIDNLKFNTYSNGQTKSEKTYDGSNLNVTKFYENGNTKYSINFKEKKLHGKSEVWYENGNKLMEEHYINGVANGKQKLWFENGKKAFVINYKNGEVSFDNDLYIFAWFENGNKRIEMKDIDTDEIYAWHSNGKKYIVQLDGRLKTWHENGNQASVYMYETDTEEEEFDGKFIRWWKNGEKLIEAYFKKGKLNGEFATYYNNGQIKFEGVALNDKLQGELNSFNYNGKKNNRKWKIAFKEITEHTKKWEEAYAENFFSFISDQENDKSMIDIINKSIKLMKD